MCVSVSACVLLVSVSAEECVISSHTKKNERRRDEGFLSLLSFSLRAVGWCFSTVFRCRPWRPAATPGGTRAFSWKKKARVGEPEVQKEPFTLRSFFSPSSNPRSNSENPRGTLPASHVCHVQKRDAGESGGFSLLLPLSPTARQKKKPCHQHPKSSRKKKKPSVGSTTR